MAATAEFILGEFPRTIDERFRLSLPAEFAESLLRHGADCILAKERPGCLSLWNAKTWQAQLDAGVDLTWSSGRFGPESWQAASKTCKRSAGSSPRATSNCNWPAAAGF
jgi:hypothetical protein